MPKDEKEPAKETKRMKASLKPMLDQHIDNSRFILGQIGNINENYFC